MHNTRFCHRFSPGNLSWIPWSVMPEASSGSLRSMPGNEGGHCLRRSLPGVNSRFRRLSHAHGARNAFTDSFLLPRLDQDSGSEHGPRGRGALLRLLR